jgi:putative cell wall-binding protein
VALSASVVVPLTAGPVSAAPLALASTAPSAALPEAPSALSGSAAVTAAVPAATALQISDGRGSVRLPVSATGVPGTATTTTSRTDVVWGPAGDAVAYTPLPAKDRTVVQASGASASTTYPASAVPVAWGPIGDGFVSREAGVFVSHATNPGFSATLDIPAGGTHVAVSPYGGSVYYRATSGSTSDIASTTAPFFGTGTGQTPVSLGLSAYSPGGPALGQQPGAGVYSDNDGDTYLAFVGTVPASSPAQYRLFVDHQDSATATGYGAPKAVASVASGCDVAAPAFSPDRTMLAYVKATDAGCTRFEVRVVRAGSTGRYDPAGANSLLRSVPAGASAPTVLSWEANNPAALQIRLGGANRYEASANIALQGWGTRSSSAMVVAGGLAYADALAGGPLAVAVDGPSVLTAPNTLRTETRTAIQASLVAGGLVYILGGTASVSTTVENQIKGLGYKTLRLGGANRYEVAVNVAKRLEVVTGRKPSTAFVSSGSAFADALVAGPPAARYEAPIVLSNGSNLPLVTKSYLDSLGSSAKIFAIGGSGAASVGSYPNHEVVGGASRYDVAGNVADRFFAFTWTAGLADGRNWPDAASGGTLMASLEEPILLANGTSTLPPGTSGFLLRSRASVDTVYAFGGVASVPQGALAAAAAAAGDQTTYYGPDIQP